MQKESLIKLFDFWINMKFSVGDLIQAQGSIRYRVYNITSYYHDKLLHIYSFRGIQ